VPELEDVVEVDVVAVEFGGMPSLFSLFVSPPFLIGLHFLRMPSICACAPVLSFYHYLYVIVWHLEVDGTLRSFLEGVCKRRGFHFW
jgi:hypothetical protein